MNMLERIVAAILPEIGKREMVLADPATLDRLAATRIARAALAAAMEPTPGMVGGAKHVPCDDVVFGGVVYSTSAEARAIWQAMCRAALDEGEG